MENQKIKLYYPISHYDKSYRRMVFPLLKPFIKGDDFTDAQRMALYGISERDFEFTDTLEEADLAILTMAWNYYTETKQTNLVIDFVNKCKALGKKVLAVSVGDFGVRIPKMENLLVLRSNGYKSRYHQNEFAIPPFIKDPLQTYFEREEIILRPYTAKPTVGFCGQANKSRINALKEILNTSLRNLKFYSGQSLQEPQQLLSTSYLRALVLKNLQKSPDIISNFIPRKKYRAGITANKERHRTTLEFYENIKDSDYVVCVRGAGNFSVRFYETLAMGRIPIFINTDCALPLEESMDWKEHVVWVEYKERDRVVENVTEFHQGLSNQDFIDLQRANRTLWEEKMSLNGFFQTFLM